jgi:L-iditol 2-dehydrogenase
MSFPKTMLGAILIGPEKIDVRNVSIPRPGPGEMLLSIEAATTCGTDVKVYKRGGHPRMLKTPTLFGHEMAGRIAALGKGVKNFSEGDSIVVANSAPCGSCEPCHFGHENLCEDLFYINGAFAEFILVPERFVQKNTYKIPKGLSFSKAAMTEPLACVLHGLDACEFDKRKKTLILDVVIFGAGPIGLLFVAALAREGHRIILADPNANRLKVGSELGATKTIKIKRGGRQANRIRAESIDQKGVSIAIDSSGVPEAWVDAIHSVRPGGLINLFGGCAPGTKINLDTNLVHYSELTIKGVYHHRPETIRRSLEMLSDKNFKAEKILTSARPIYEVEEALKSMISKEALKVVISNR